MVPGVTPAKSPVAACASRLKRPQRKRRRLQRFR